MAKAKSDLSYEALNDILMSSANSGHKISNKTFNELIKLSGKEKIDVEHLRDKHEQDADEKYPPMPQIG